MDGLLFRQERAAVDGWKFTVHVGNAIEPAFVGAFDCQSETAMIGVGLPRVVTLPSGMALICSRFEEPHFRFVTPDIRSGKNTITGFSLKGFVLSMIS
jgi:hypothetical protein